MPDEETLLGAYEQARAQGLVLVTDGRELKYTLPHHVPPGFLPFALVQRAAAPAANDPRS